MIHETAQIQGIDILHIDPLILDHLQLPGVHLKIHVLDILIVIKNSIPIELHHIQVTLAFIINDKKIDLLRLLLSVIIPFVFLLHPTLETDSTLEIIILHVDLNQEHVLDLRLHLEDLSKIYNQVPLKIMATKLKAFEGQRTNLKLTSIQLK